MRCSFVRNREAGRMAVGIVDSRLSDYAALPKVVNHRDMHWHFATSGRSAMRPARSQQIDLWVINTVLPDMSGMDLCGTLKGRYPRPSIYIVTDAYRIEDERAARVCGISLFGCKPIQPSWFEF